MDVNCWQQMREWHKFAGWNELSTSANWICGICPAMTWRGSAVQIFPDLVRYAFDVILATWRNCCLNKFAYQFASALAKAEGTGMFVMRAIMQSAGDRECLLWCRAVVRVLNAILLARGGAELTGIVLMWIVVLVGPTSMVIVPGVMQNLPDVSRAGVVMAVVDDLGFCFTWAVL